jgi:beta-galactosidase
MANRMDCPPLFTMTDWADVRLSAGDNGSFLFINNYQDDPIETTIAASGIPLFGGGSITLPARRGAILPLEWRIKSGIVVHYLTAEVIEVSDAEGQLTIKTDQPEFTAELSLDGYRCDDSLILQRVNEQRVKLHGRHGVIELVSANT